VISREHVISGNWQALYDETREMREACNHAHLKVILATGELPTLRDVYKASMVAMMAGADFIKTSTGKVRRHGGGGVVHSFFFGSQEPTNATLPVGLVMMRAVREFYERTGFKVGFKPAGGIRTAKDALSWLSLMLEELGPGACAVW
jgi:deoxyribose-phosphate aldolase